MEQIFGTHGIPHVVHADRGTSMTSNTVAGLPDLGVTRSHSRPKVSNDNPTASPGSRPSSTPRPSRNASHPSTTHEISWMNSSPGITTSIGTAGSVYTPPPMCSTAWPRRRTPSGDRCLPRPEHVTATASAVTAPQDHRPTRNSRHQPAQTTRIGGPDDSCLTPAGLKHLDKFRIPGRVEDRQAVVAFFSHPDRPSKPADSVAGVGGDGCGASDTGEQLARTTPSTVAATAVRSSILMKVLHTGATCWMAD